jgi:tRNA-2-methylthio-N6-dimethylallyladenosine synthase
MNVADSYRVAAALENLGYKPTSAPKEADVIVLNTCVVRASAEQKAVGRLTSLESLKTKNPNLVLSLMGCMVGIRDFDDLQKRYPYVDVFSQPSDPGPLINFLQGKPEVHSAYREVADILDADFAYTLPGTSAGTLVSAYLPIIYGCSHACSYCVIPLRRGREISRAPGKRSPSADSRP